MTKQHYTYTGDTPILLKDFLKSVGISKKLLTKLKREYMGITRNSELIRSIDMVQPNDTVVLSIEDTTFVILFSL